MYICKQISIWCCAVIAATLMPLYATANDNSHNTDDKLSVGDIINEHIADSYWWHITTINNNHISVYLPVIVYSPGDGGWNIFSSKRLAHGASHNGFSIATGGKYKGKIVGINANGETYRPYDISLTKNTLSLMINSVIMLVIFLSAARSYRQRPRNTVPSKFVCAIEMIVMDIEKNVIQNSIGTDYKRYSPYLLTAFFFILINNLMGLIPFIPGGASTTGNIAITMMLALGTLIAVNVFGNREYWKEIFWPEVPLWLKVPVPMIPVIELFGVISKPFALMIRLLANIFAGHTAAMAFMMVIFLTVKMGTGINAGMTVFSVIMSVFMSFLEILVAYIQAYVFTLLSAVFIGLSRPEEHHHAKIKKIQSEIINH